MITSLYSAYHFIWSLVSALVFRFPSRKLHVVGITGTKGKTTTVALLSYIFDRAGHTTAFLSSAEEKIGNSRGRNKTGNSMPGRWYIQRFLRRAADAGCSFAFVEVTSQGVVQHRHRYIRWRDLGFLNIHPEHIESHGSFERYLAAKAAFFSYGAGQKDSDVRFFVNARDPRTQDMIVSVDPTQVVYFESGDLSGHEESIPLTLEGDFNRANIAAARAIALREGISDEEFFSALPEFPGIPGRMQFVAREPFRAVVDYAHTPDSLRAVYTHLRGTLPEGGRLVCVLGSAGGGRDTWKRAAFGALAGELCDAVYITNEDPYDESPRTIMEQIYEGMDEKFRSKAVIIEDRREAIRAALRAVRAGDILICTGKGSEAWIHGKNGALTPWNEAEVVREEIGTL